MSRQTFNRGLPCLCLTPACQRGESGEETLKNKVCRKKQNVKLPYTPTPEDQGTLWSRCWGSASTSSKPLFMVFHKIAVCQREAMGRKKEKKDWIFFFKMDDAGVQRKSRSNYLSFDLKSANILKVVHRKKEGEKLGERKGGGAEKEKTRCFVLPVTDGCFLFYFIMHISAAT